MIMFRRDVTGCHSLRCLRPETLQQSLIGGEDEVGVEKAGSRRRTAPGACPPDGGCSGLAHAAASAQAPPAPPARPGAEETRLPRRRRGGGRERGERAPTHPGRRRRRRLGGPSLRRGPVAAPRRSSPHRPPGRPLPLPNVCALGRSSDPASAAAAAALRGRRSDVSRLPSERARPSGAAGRAAGEGGALEGCVREGAGRPAGARPRARTRAPALAPPFPPRGRDPDTSPPPPPPHPRLWGRRACAALGSAWAHLFSLLPQCERSAAQITAGCLLHPRPAPTPPTPERPGFSTQTSCGPWLLQWLPLSAHPPMFNEKQQKRKEEAPSSPTVTRPCAVL
ncbi:translation initiation factor IF-2-like [Microtus oregoni]|uniref:translation initiation factor IF-2-like n=1 Tax=Microtus oregoni TaxID=111838 RepID=UPI001BB286FF|nr:translation initiation factor IF-2-like [Microtus oregoni]